MELNIMNLFILALVFGITAGYAALQNHWSEFSFLMALTAFSVLGFVFRLLA